MYFSAAVAAAVGPVCPKKANDAMLTYWMDLRDPLRALETMWLEAAAPRVRTATFPRASLEETKDAFVLRAEVPGLAEDDIELSVTSDSLRVSGERKGDVPEGYKAQRRERGELRFSRSFEIPRRIDVERVSAEIKQGLLTVTLPKHPDTLPKSIAVKAA